ncbi:hypothetical protein VB620_09035 [Nodularia harveyana UHCC-0300]|uniref:Secreted protein n=1 Tax=Nodularia harveyana UHCC-0300 TaxID=2974287 RepID=A0ABU5UDA2_9CYAN|nr:hypothetical protein [Nodularia harveyana]MEA5581482.1 hypothetical protein [Nodularia harveyana UHCC-0300]
MTAMMIVLLILVNDGAILAIAYDKNISDHKYPRCFGVRILSKMKYQAIALSSYLNCDRHHRNTNKPQQQRMFSPHRRAEFA